MELFIRSAQYHFIKNQAKILVNGNGTVNDKAVLKALRELAKEKASQLFNTLPVSKKS